MTFGMTTAPKNKEWYAPHKKKTEKKDRNMQKKKTPSTSCSDRGAGGIVD